MKLPSLFAIYPLFHPSHLLLCSHSIDITNSHNAWKPLAETQRWRKLAETRTRQVPIRTHFTQPVFFRVTRDFVGTHVESFYSSSIGRIYSDVSYHYVALFLLNRKISLIISGRFGVDPRNLGTLKRHTDGLKSLPGARLIFLSRYVFWSKIVTSLGNRRNVNQLP